MALLQWYDREHRVLPWRRNAHSLHQKQEEPDLKQEDPEVFMYRVWVSEVSTSLATAVGLLTFCR